MVWVDIPDCFVAKLGEPDTISLVVGDKPIREDNGYVLSVFFGW